MKSITIIGYGNVGSHLCSALRDKGFSVTVLERSDADFSSRLQTIDADVVLLCVPDDQVAKVAARMKDNGALVCHVSGAVSMDVLARYFENCGVFYPLQTFTKGRSMDYARIPVLVEANTEDGRASLKQLGSSFSGKIHEMTTEQRQTIHLAAVFVNNFTNAMMGIAENVLHSRGIPTDILRPLMEETMVKVTETGALRAQTGPARRGDRGTQEKHMTMLSGKEKEIYKLMSDYIFEHYNS